MTGSDGYIWYNLGGKQWIISYYTNHPIYAGSSSNSNSSTNTGSNVNNPTNKPSTNTPSHSNNGATIPSKPSNNTGNTSHEEPYVAGKSLINPKLLP